MSMLEYLEKDKEKVLSELVSAALPERAVKVMESEMDRLLYQYNESEEEERLRSAASAMTETAKVSLAYLTSMGEPKIWERYEDDDPDFCWWARPFLLPPWCWRRRSRTGLSASWVRP